MYIKLLKYLSIKDGLKQLRSGYMIGTSAPSKVPVHKRWIETFYFKNVNTLPKHLLKYLSIKDGLKLC